MHILDIIIPITPPNEKNKVISPAIAPITISIPTPLAIPFVNLFLLILTYHTYLNLLTLMPYITLHVILFLFCKSDLAK